MGTVEEARIEAMCWVVAAGLIAGALGAVGDSRVWAWSPWWPLIGGVLCAVVALLQAGTLPVGVFRAASWLTAAGWVGWCYRYTAWQATTWEALAVGTVVFAVVAAALPVSASPEPTGTPVEAEAPPESAPDGSTPNQWETRLAGPGGVAGCTVSQIIPWGTGTGYDVPVEHPQDGSDWMVLAGRQRQLTASLRLPPGCGVEVGPGEHSGASLIRVSTRDMLATPRTYTDTSPLSITGPIPLGTLRDGRPAEVVMHLESSLALAAPNQGKSNWLHTLIAGYVRCPDALVWVIDPTGRLAAPWLRPWRTGQTRRPAVDWVATDATAARIMTEFAIQVIIERSKAYQDLMAAADTDVLAPAVGPAIRIVVDEFAESGGTKSDPVVRANLIRIGQLGRAMGVRVDIAILRATETVIPMDALRLIGVRAAFGVHDAAELGYALGWSTKLALGEAAHPGQGWLRPNMAAGLHGFRTPHTALPSTIATIAAACEGRRPVLDEPSLRVPLRRAYEQRWNRYEQHARGARPTGNEHASPAAGGDAREHPRDGSSASGLGALDRAIHRARVSSMPPQVTGDVFTNMVGPLEQELLAGMAGQRATGEASARERMRAVLDAAGPAGILGTQVAEQLRAGGHEVPSSTLYDWLAQDAVKVQGQFVAHRHASGGTP